MTTSTHKTAMFDSDFFDEWLDKRANQAMHKITSEEKVTPEEMMVIMLKSQTNHIAHLDTDLHNEMIALRKDMDERFEQSKIDMDKRFEQSKIDMDKRFEQVDKRFEQSKIDMDKRFEQVDKRFDAIVSRMDSFMKWSLSSTLLASGLVVGAIQLLK